MAYTDRFPIVKNFFETQLAVGCDAGETQLYFTAVNDMPEILVGRDYVPLVLREALGAREIVYVESVNREASTVRVLRGQEGTIARAWGVGTYVYCTVTAESFQRMRVNSFAPMVDKNDGRPAITRLSPTSVAITGDFTSQIEAGMAVRVLSGDATVAPSDSAIGAIFASSVSYADNKTTVQFQNVSLPATVSGLDLGISMAAAPLYHPDSPVGDGETITLEGGVLKITEEFQEAQNSAIREAQATADSALEEAQNITVPVQSVMGKTGHVTGLVCSINDQTPDANGNLEFTVFTSDGKLQFPNGAQLWVG